MNRTVQFILLDADYEMYSKYGESRPIIRLWGRSNKRIIEIRIIDFLPYLYIDANEEQMKSLFIKEKVQIKNWLRRTIKCKKRLYFNGISCNVLKLIGNEPFRVPEIRNIIQKAGISVYEADIPFIQRFLIDSNIKILHEVTAIGKILREEKNILILETSSNNIFISPESDKDYQPVIIAFDIEVDEHGEAIQELLANVNRRITAISLAWGTVGIDIPNSEVLILEKDTNEAEYELLNKFIKIINEMVKPDILLSFNGTFFDIPYLKARMEQYGKSLGSLALYEGLQTDIVKFQIPIEGYRLKGRAIVDLLPKTWGIHHVSGKKNLNTIAEKVLGESKVQVEKSLGELWRNGVQGRKEDLKLFRDYSLQDAILTFRLGIELAISDNIELCRLSGYPLSEGLLTTSRNIGELELMRIIHSKDLLIPSKPNAMELKKRNELKEKYPHLGGWVLDPTVNEATYVAILDFRSLYPNIVRQNNISGETLRINSEEYSPEKRFIKEPLGALAELMNKILEERYKIIKEIDKSHLADNESSTSYHFKILEKRQKSLKLMANSLLGASNYPRGRFYHHLISNSITAIARALLKEKLHKWTEEFSRNQNYEVYLRYGDTDSIFVEFRLNINPIHFLQESIHDSNRIKELKRLLEAINTYRKFLEQKLPQFLELKLEDIALRIILKRGRKKAYAYRSLQTDEIIIRGFEAVRSDWSPYSKKTQRNLLKILLNDFGKTRKEKSRKIVFEACRYILQEPTQKLIEELTIRGPLKRSPSDYRSKTPAVGAFLHYCKEKNLNWKDEWKNWDGFPYIIAKGSKKYPQYKRAFHPDTFLNGKKRIDRIHYVLEILGASKRFGIRITQSEIIQGAHIIPLTVFLF